MEPEKIESEAEEMNLGGYYSPTDDNIGDGARRDQPASATTMTPQHIFDEEIMKNISLKNSKTSSLATTRRRTAKVSSCQAAMQNS